MHDNDTGKNNRVMYIFNIMLGRGLGGIEQSFLDYALALQQENVSIMAVIHPKAAIKEKLVEHQVPFTELPNKGQWDLLARKAFKKLLTTHQPTACILHGNRAISLCRTSTTPCIGVTHNYRFRRMKKLDAVFYTTKHLKNALTAINYPEKQMFWVPNMIDTTSIAPTLSYTPHSPVIIGAMGRYVKKKGFHIYLNALAQLKQSGLIFKAVIAGSGEEEESLRELAKELGIAYSITFLPWVEDKEAFFKSIDIFCLPSLHEPFGIILLEALAAGKPCAVTLSEGPSEIVQHRFNALTCPTDDTESLATILRELVTSQQLVQSLVKNAPKAVTPYTMKAVGKLLKGALTEITKSAT